MVPICAMVKSHGWYEYIEPYVHKVVNITPITMVFVGDISN